MRIDAKAVPLLVSYGMGCIDTLVSDGKMNRVYADSLISRVFDGKPLDEADARSFKVAYAKCATLARKLGKKSIDAEVIRTYFLDPSEHNRFVDALFAAVKDFDPVECKAQVGVVLQLGKGSATVKTRFNGKEYTKSYGNHLRGLKEGDEVVVHSGHIAEGMSTELNLLIEQLKSADATQKELLIGVFDSKKRRYVRS